VPYAELGVGHALPCAEMHLLEALVEDRLTEFDGEQARARERARMQAVVRRQQRAQACGGRGRRLAQADVGLPVAYAGRHVRVRVADQVKFHATRIAR